MKKLLFSFLMGVLLGIVTLSFPHGAYAKTFQDVSQSHWAYNSVMKATDYGFVKGYPNGAFQPQGKVTRAEFAAFLSRIFDTTDRVSEPFTDVSDSYWAKDAIEKGIALGFIQPSEYTNNQFKPSQAMTRAEIANWLAHGLAYVNSEYQTIMEEFEKSSTALLPVTEFYRGGIKQEDIPSISIAMGTGLLIGYPDQSFQPSGNTTRAEVATILIRFLNVMKKNPDEFSDLKEFREVALTGTNIKTVANYKVVKNTSGFEDIIGKPLEYDHGIGKGTIERVILVDTRSTSSNAGAFKDMFIGPNTFIANDRFTVFIEYTFTPYKDVNYVMWFAKNYVPLYSAFQADTDKAKQFGYRAANTSSDALEVNHFFKTGKTNYFWGMSSLPYGYEFSTYNDDAGVLVEYVPQS